MILVALGLLVVDCLVIVFWVGGFVLLASGNLHGVTYGAHALTVLMTMMAQMIWRFRCPLIIWRNKIMGTDTDVLNPYLITLIRILLRTNQSTANKFLSGIIFLGGLFYIFAIVRKLV